MERKSCPNCPDHGPLEGGYGICECECHPTTAGERWAVEELERLRALLNEVLPRLGVTDMTHNGHLNGCPRSYDDWMPADPCECSRDDLVRRVAAAAR